MPMSAQRLVQCINQFALQESNPVISILPESGLFELNQKYPKPMLSFPGTGLRAYYHSHSYASRPDEENGHFHIFLNMDDDLKLENEKWSHLAGLAMDSMGQPVRWFTVNHWVTGETWCPADMLNRKLDLLTKKDSRELSLVEQWIKAIIEFYTLSLNQLLEERDRVITKLIQEKNLNAILQDRAIYGLSHRPINLLYDLESYVNLVNSHNLKQSTSVPRGIL
ncbi:DUF6969 family protein [Kaarinaea lacus]